MTHFHSSRRIFSGSFYVSIFFLRLPLPPNPNPPPHPHPHPHPQVLCTSGVRRLLDDNAVTWGGRVLDPEAYELSAQFKVRDGARVSEGVGAGAAPSDARPAYSPTPQ